MIVFQVAIIRLQFAKMDNADIEETVQENILLQIVRDVCTTESPLSSAIKAKVNKIMSECDLAPYLSLHRFTTVDESASNALGIIQKCTTELTYKEQMELNQIIIQTIQNKLPSLITELEAICSSRINKESKGLLIQDLEREEQKRGLMESVDHKLNTLKEQEGEKVELMMEWLGFKMHDALNYTNNITELYAVKSKTLDLKSKILHLQILHSMFSETNKSVQAYSELQHDLQESIHEAERNIQQYKHIIHND